MRQWWLNVVVEHVGLASIVQACEAITWSEVPRSNDHLSLITYHSVPKPFSPAAGHRSIYIMFNCHASLFLRA